MQSLRIRILHGAKKIWLMIRRLWHKEKRGVAVIAPTTTLPGAAMAPVPQPIKPRDLHEKLPRRARFFNNRYPGPNMPKRQPCPQCRKNCRRVEKVDSHDMSGARYYCPTHHIKFFVSV